MVFFHVFCFWFSLRVGSIMIGIFTLVQCTIWLMFSIISLNNVSEVSEQLNKLIAELSVKNALMHHLADDPKGYLIMLVTFSTIFLISCILMIYGSYQCNFLLMYPFVIADLIYIIFLATQHVFLMLYLKEQNYGLGKLILYSNLGGFLILFFLYMWACVISYIKVIKLLLKGIENNNKRERRRILKQNLVKHPNQVTVSLFGIGNDEESTHD